MRPPLCQLGNHQHFGAYQALFDSTYKNGVVRDIFGNQVHFGYSNRYGLHDCHHVCYGGTKANWENAAKWRQERAERILWIGPALSDPSIKVYADPGHWSRRRYLLVVDAEPQQNWPAEYFCVVTHIVGTKHVMFITAYNITRETWEEYQRLPDRFYPPSKLNKTGRKGSDKRKKKGTA